MADRESNLANFFSTTLSFSVGSTDTSFSVTTTVGGPASPCYIIIDPESATNREIIYCDGAFTGTTFVTSTVNNRDLDANGNLDHVSGKTVWVSAVAQHFDDLNDRIDAAETDITTAQTTADAAQTTADAALPKAGGTMAGNIDMGGNVLTNYTVQHNGQSGNYTLALTDAGKVIQMDSASALVLTVPPNSGVAFPTGTLVEAIQMGGGALTIAAGAGVTINSPGGLLALDGQYATATLRKRGTDVWSLDGRLA